MPLDKFVVCIFRFSDPSGSEAKQFLERLDSCFSQHDGKVVLRSSCPEDWQVYDGKHNFIAPNHLNPAIFDFNCILLIGFESFNAVQNWWKSEEMFSCLMRRKCAEKIGIYSFDGLRELHHGTEKFAFAEKFVYMEFLSIQNFRLCQRFLDLYKRFSEKAILEIGMDCNLLFSDTAHDVFMSEFPLYAMCASGWRLKTDPHFWYDSTSYKHQLQSWREDNSVSFAAVIPVMDHRAAIAEKLQGQGGGAGAFLNRRAK